MLIGRLIYSNVFNTRTVDDERLPFAFSTKAWRKCKKTKLCTKIFTIKKYSIRPLFFKHQTSDLFSVIQSLPAENSMSLCLHGILLLCIKPAMFWMKLDSFSSFATCSIFQLSLNAQNRLSANDEADSGGGRCSLHSGKCSWLLQSSSQGTLSSF